MKLFFMKIEGAKTPSILLIVILISNVLFSQKREIKYYDSPKRIQIGFSINPSYIPKLKLNQQFGTVKFESGRAIGFEVGFDLKFNLSKSFALNTGFYWGKLPNHIKFSFRNGQYSLVDGYEIDLNDYDYFIGYNYIPLYFEQIIIRKPNIKNSIFLGINIRDYPDGLSSTSYHYGGSDTSKSNETFFDFSIDFNHPYKLRLNYQLGTLFYFKQKNFNHLRVGIFYNFSSENLINGYYEFFKGTLEHTYGTVKSSGSYLAFNISYFFSGKKIKTQDGKKIRLVSTFF
jgi:hypothetical protein